MPPVHDHHHAPGQPHPATPAAWSLMRLALPARLAGSAACAIALWSLVLLAMR